MLGKLLSIVGRMLALCGAVMALAGLPLLPLYLLFTEWDIGFTVSLCASAFGVLLAVLGLQIHLYSKRLGLQSAEQVLAADGRDPVLYLRPFAADTQSTEYRDVGLLSNVFPDFSITTYHAAIAILRAVPTLIRLAINPPLTDEEQLAKALSVFGPVIAVAAPSETLPPAGIPRLRFATSQWQEQVATLLKRARLVLIQCGTSNQSGSDGYWPTPRAIEGGFRWELNIVTAQVLPERLVLLLPFDGLEYESFCGKVQDVFPCKLPPYWRATATKSASRAVLWFDANWTPFLAPITWLDGLLRLDTRSPIVASLRSKFQAFTGRGFNFRYGGSRLGKRLIAVLIDFLVIGAVTIFMLALASQLRSVTNDTFLFPALLALLPIVACAYSVLFEASALSTTGGKLLMGLMVVDTSGCRLSLAAALRRAATKYFLLPITWVPALFGADGETLHDRWSHSTVTLGALRVSEPPRRPFAVLTFAAIAVTYLLGIGSIIRPPLYFPPGVDRVELSFHSVKGFIVIQASLKGHPLTLLLNSTDVPTMVDRSLATIVGIKGFDKTTVSLGGKYIVADVSLPYDVKLSSVLLTNARLYVADLSALTDAVGVHIDGVIGHDLLRHGVVEIDYLNKRLVIVKPESFHYDGAGERIPITIVRGMPSIEATIKVPGHQAINDRFWLNPGVPGGVNYPLIRYSSTALTGFSRSSSSRDAVITVGNIEYIQLGKFKVEGPLSVCCTGVDEVDRRIGSTALSQFNVILDYPNSSIILEQQK